MPTRADRTPPGSPPSARPGSPSAPRSQAWASRPSASMRLGAELDPPFPVHYHLLGADKYGITSLQNLAQLPPKGAAIIVAPLPIVGGTGSPARVYALVEA